MNAVEQMSNAASQHQVILSPAYKKELWLWLNERFRSELKTILAIPGSDLTHSGAEQLQSLIRLKLGEDGIKDAEDMYQLVVGTTAEEFWCEALQELRNEQTT
jgi:hypothetical protein